ncbi:Sensory histidine kinase BaeS [Paramagnetospirillum magnetotacticum MS-1]|uniref:histidine kinase n=2 Tax=Paramagnetospirillum magnetotacticum TaxID=188 RepID=A0A0C2UF96_PARME|nr:Sensory histidine kinase BaeS [Paramagnetospirillum magnetotacticum MS-1]
MLLGALVIGLIAVPGDSVSRMAFAIAPSIVVVGYAVVWDGFRRFTGRPPLSPVMIMFLGSAALLLLALIAIQGSMAFRVALNTSVAGVICAIISIELFLSAGQGQRAMRITATLYAASSVFFLQRTVAVMIDPTQIGPVGVDSIQTPTALWWLAMPLTITLGMILMTGERLQMDINQKMIRLDEVTAQKLAEERLRMAEKERMEGALRQWMADSSHELRTPISVLRAQIEAIQDGVFTADARRLEVLHHEVMGMTRLVEDLFLLARSDIGQLECRSDPIDILDVLDGVIHAFRGRYAEAGLGLEAPDDSAGGLVISGDAVRLRQVFSNLLENSLRYTDPGGRLVISHRGQGAGVLFHFDDTAPGVSEDNMAHLFDRFFRVDVSRSRESGGSGLGLALSRTLIEAHGGTIEAMPSPLGGLRIAVRFSC